MQDFSSRKSKGGLTNAAGAIVVLLVALGIIFMLAGVFGLSFLRPMSAAIMTTGSCSQVCVPANPNGVSVTTTMSYPNSLVISGTVPSPSSGQSVAISVSNGTGIILSATVAVNAKTGGFSKKFAGLSSFGFSDGTYSLAVTWESSTGAPISSANSTLTWTGSTTSTTT